MSNIHPTAIVHPKAELGNDVVIGAYCLIGDDVIIDDGTIVESHAVIEPGTRLGKRCKVGHHAVLGGDPQDLKFSGEKTTLEIGDETVIREFVTLNRGTEYHHRTVIGKNCFLMAYAHVAHDCILGDHVIIANAVNMGGHVEIGSHAIVGGLAAIHQFVKIGPYAFVGGGTRIRQDIPPYIRVSGEPAHFIGTNHIGLSRKGFSSDTILEIKRAYRIIYRSKYTPKEAIEVIQKELKPLEEINTIIEFIKRSDRGLIRGKA